MAENHDVVGCILPYQPYHLELRPTAISEAGLERYKIFVCIYSSRAATQSILTTNLTTETTSTKQTFGMALYHVLPSPFKKKKKQGLLRASTSSSQKKSTETGEECSMLDARCRGACAPLSQTRRSHLCVTVTANPAPNSGTSCSYRHGIDRTLIISSYHSDNRRARRRRIPESLPR